MGFKATVQSAVLAAFSAVGDIKKTVTLVRNNSNPTYNPATGATTSSTTSYQFDCVVTGYDRDEIDGENILATDIQVILPQSSLSVVPALKDTLTIDSVTCNIKNISKDPADATWVIQARRA